MTSDDRMRKARETVAQEALSRGRDAKGLGCPNCGREMLDANGPDVELGGWASYGVALAGGGLIVLGSVSLLVVMVVGEIAFPIADLSTIGIALGLAGIGMLVLAGALRFREEGPSAYECMACGYKVE